MALLIDNAAAVDRLHLHDMGLLDIRISYAEHLVELQLCEVEQSVRTVHRLLFEQMHRFSITAHEPWGAGVYVHEIKATPCRDGSQSESEGRLDNAAFVTELLLNSGDVIQIVSSRIHYH